MKSIGSVKFENDKSTVSVWDNILKRHLKPSDECSDIILLGNQDSGKASLIRALQAYGMNCDINDSTADLFPETGGVSFIEHSYLPIRNPDEKLRTKAKVFTSIWILQSAKHANLFVDLIKNRSFKNCAFIICLDLTKPDSLLKDLIQWIEIASTIFDAMKTNITPERLIENQTKLLKYLKKLPGTPAEVNLGMPITVVVTKADYSYDLDARDTMGHMKVIGVYLRKICVQYGAALIFISAQNNQKNCDVLYKYIVHRMHNYNFNMTPSYVYNESLFIPSGYDDIEEIEKAAADSLCEGFTKPFNAIIRKPVDIEEELTEVQKYEVITINNFLKAMIDKYPNIISVETLGAKVEEDNVKDFFHKMLNKVEDVS